MTRWVIEARKPSHHVKTLYYCLCSVARIGWSDRMSNLEVKNRVLGAGSENIQPYRMKPTELH